jgi:hypothetical protein
MKITIPVVETAQDNCAKRCFWLDTVEEACTLTQAGLACDRKGFIRSDECVSVVERVRAKAKQNFKLLEHL